MFAWSCEVDKIRSHGRGRWGRFWCLSVLTQNSVSVTYQQYAICAGCDSRPAATLPPMVKMVLCIVCWHEVLR
jgi:hypothetical protein